MWLCVLLCAPLVLMACADTVGVGAGVVNSPTAKFNYGQASSDDNATSINTPFQYKIGPDGSFSNDGASYLFNWRLAVFPLRVPSPPSDYLQPNADYSQNLHIAKTQFQLQWDTESRNKSLATYLAERNLSSISFAMVHMKANSTMLSAYSGQLDGDCTALLGRDCTLSLGSATNYVTRNLSSLSGCSSVFPSEAPKYRTWELNAAFLNSSAFNPNADRYTGDSIFYVDSEPYAPGNLTAFQEAESALNIFILDISLARAYRSGTVTTGPIVMCRIIDKSKASAANGGPSLSKKIWIFTAVTLMTSIFVSW